MTPEPLGIALPSSARHGRAGRRRWANGLACDRRADMGDDRPPAPGRSGQVDAQGGRKWMRVRVKCSTRLCMTEFDGARDDKSSDYMLGRMNSRGEAAHWNQPVSATIWA